MVQNCGIGHWIQGSKAHWYLGLVSGDTQNKILKSSKFFNIIKWIKKLINLIINYWHNNKSNNFLNY